VAERTVELLRRDPRVSVTIIPSLSFLDLAWDRLSVDPLADGARIIDGTRFAEESAGERGPLLVGQCWSPQVLSEIKLAIDPGGPDATGHGPTSGAVPQVTLLHHLGLPEEQVLTVDWWRLDQVLEPDQLTSVWIPQLGTTIANDVVRLEELSRTLRQRCPWDREQTHASLKRHLLEEAYEVLDAIDAIDAIGAAAIDVTRAGTPGTDTGANDAVVGPIDLGADQEAVDHLCEELGDLLFQVVFHSTLATEEGRFNFSDVARGIHDKLVTRHPHVFADTVAETPDAVAENWEAIKRVEKGRTSVTDGIPNALPALALTAKLQRKAQAVGLPSPTFDAGRNRLVAAITELEIPASEHSAEPMTAPSDQTVQRIGAMLFDLTDLARRLGVDPEDALRATALAFRDHIVEAEPRA
jgi:tetrapyrrole methylase family protein / MazG family protein